MIERLLRCFPQQTHALTLAVDPAGYLRQSEIAERLAALGFRCIEAGDPIAFRRAWVDALPCTPASPLIVVTGEAANLLPYDVWQQGVVVELGPAHFFPQLDVTLLAGMSLAQLERLDQAYAEQPPASTLSRAATLDYVLFYVFGSTPAQLVAAGPLLRWLAELHANGETLPAPLCSALVPLLNRRPPLDMWPLGEMLADRAAFHAFAQAQWQGYVRSLAETGTAYLAQIPFAVDPATQAIVPLLVGSGAITPVAVDATLALPSWSTAGVRVDAALGRMRRWQETMTAVEGLLAASTVSWAAWQAVAVRWAALTAQRYGGAAAPDPACVPQYAVLAKELAPAFATWLKQNYSALANRQLPVPHHLYHVPGWLAQRVARGERVALIVLDGMSLAAWRVIRDAWERRHPTWQMGETLVLAQIPTITAISRQALLAGRPPRAFADSLSNNRQEAAYWRQYWEQQGLAAGAVAYAAIPSVVDRPAPDALDNRYTRALAIVAPDIDALVHGATEGLAGFYAGLNVWLEHGTVGSQWLEALIQRLLDQGYHVAVTSDHGHVEAIGIGQPQEGVLVTTRAKRARIYPNAHFARLVQEGFGNTTLWYDDGLLPDNCWVLMPNGADAFAAPGQRVVSHGGITLDEVIVPLIEIEQSNG